MDASYNKAEKILSDNIEKLHLIAARLIETETMEAEQFELIMTGEQIESEAKTEEE
jgi:cell division protease FtsH